MSFNLPGHIPDDPDNPYSAPKPDVREPHSRSRLTGTTVKEFEIGEVLSQAWAIFKDQMGLCIGVYLVTGIIVQGAQYVLQGLLLALQAGGASPIAIFGVL